MLCIRLFAAKILSQQVIRTESFFLVEAVLDLYALFHDCQDDDGFPIAQRSTVTGPPLKGEFISGFDWLVLHPAAMGLKR
jgi:hypothetical protein